MAKQTKMAAEASAVSAEELAKRTYIVPDGVWEEAGGEEYGGKSEILVLQAGEVAGPFVYVGHQTMTTELGETTVHLATTKEKDTMRLPIQATFLRAVDQADLKRGDTFLVRRFEDQIKKRGKGAGNEMAIYGIRVLHRIPAPVPA